VDGELFVVGRIKDMLIVRGRNVAPQDLEATACAAHEAAEPGVGAAFSLDDGTAERVVVVQALRRGIDPDLDEVREAIRGALSAEHGVGAEVVLVRPHSVPRTGSGKIRRSACRDAYLAGELNPLGEQLGARGAR